MTRRLFTVAIAVVTALVFTLPERHRRPEGQAVPVGEETQESGDHDRCRIMLRCQPSPQPPSCGTRGASPPMSPTSTPTGKGTMAIRRLHLPGIAGCRPPRQRRLLVYDGRAARHGRIGRQGQWQGADRLLFHKGHCVDALEQAVKEATARLGKAPCKRRVIMMLPDPIIHRHYIDTTTTTTYWGELGGRRLDFNSNEDRVAACRWYIDQVRARFAQGDINTSTWPGSTGSARSPPSRTTRSTATI